jgi:hypothetical protein
MMCSVAAAAATLALGACAATRQDARNTPSDFSADVGVATERDVYDKVRKVLTRYHYAIETSSGPPNIWIETQWRERPPFADERERRIEWAQTRVIVRANPRAQTSRHGLTFSVHLLVENRVRRSADGNWEQIPATREFTDHASRLAQELRTEFETGVRTY